MDSTIKDFRYGFRTAGLQAGRELSPQPRMDLPLLTGGRPPHRMPAVLQRGRNNALAGKSNLQPTLTTTVHGKEKGREMLQRKCPVL